ncbi:MAG: L-idonate 5-dehydrogenase [uncultured Propionibacteriaceae bacterium]|uniref:L-idonate 5-dehydrogenase n=1 Tax=uncultured Propionibacteriaceae bacterium TaxID=257457 RepID=A0A6J4NXC1_9ACTN|nr:MAG: L-idonate 5-dehydrogenase [uncultured Propionibacteriaceae bacterium]
MSSAGVPARGLGVVAYAAGDLRVEEVPIRAPGRNEALVEVLYGGICGSDLHYWQDGASGTSVLRAPMLLGHEIVGRVAAAATDGSGPLAGTHVAVHPARPDPGDGSVRYPYNRPNLSPAGTYLGSAAHLPHTDGAFVKYAALPTTLLRPVAATVPLRSAALAEPASVAWHAVRRAGEIVGKRVLVIGSGPIGALVVAVLKRAGAAEIIAVDLQPLALQIASQVGATRTILAADRDAVDAVDADVVIESSGSRHGLAAAIRATTRGGRIVLVGMLPSGDQPIPIATAIVRELELVGSFRFNDEIDEVISALEDGSLHIDPVVTHEFDVSDAVEAFGVALDAARSGKVLLRF